MGTWSLKTHLTKYYQSCQHNFNVMQFHRCEAASGVVANDVQTVETPQDDILSAERTICDIKNEGVSLLTSLRSKSNELETAEYRCQHLARRFASIHFPCLLSTRYGDPLNGETKTRKLAVARFLCVSGAS